MTIQIAKVFSAKLINYLKIGWKAIGTLKIWMFFRSSEKF